MEKIIKIKIDSDAIETVRKETRCKDDDATIISKLLKKIFGENTVTEIA